LKTTVSLTHFFIKYVGTAPKEEKAVLTGEVANKSHMPLASWWDTGNIIN